MIIYCTMTLYVEYGMKKSQLVSEICKLYPFLKNEQVDSIVDQVFSTIGEGLAEGKRTEIRGFGSFSPRTRNVQLKFATQTDKVEFGSKRSIYFRMGKELFDRLNKPVNDNK